MTDDRRPSGRQHSTVDAHEDDDRIFSCMRFGQLSCFSFSVPGFRLTRTICLSHSLTSVLTHRTHASHFTTSSLHRYVLLYPTLAIDIVPPRANRPASSTLTPATHVAAVIRAPRTTLVIPSPRRTTCHATYRYHSHRHHDPHHPTLSLPRTQTNMTYPTVCPLRCCIDVVD